MPRQISLFGPGNPKSNFNMERKIYLLCSNIVNLAELTNSEEFLIEFKQENYVQGLNLKSFTYISYFLIKVIDPQLAQRLPWPIKTQKENHAFLTLISNISNEIRKNPCYSANWLPISQRSHFLNPRSDNKKVIEFLLGLSTLSIKVFTGTIHSKRTLKECSDEVIQFENEIAQDKLEIEKLKKDIEEIKERNEKCPIELEKLKQDILANKFLESLDGDILMEMMKVKEDLEKELIEVMNLTQQALTEFHIS